MTKQEVFNKVWDHFVTKRNPQSISADRCMYRQDGTPTCPVRCAVGLFIPDAEYSTYLEGAMPATIMGHIPSMLLIDVSIKFWDDLQRCHDNAAYVDFHNSVRDKLEIFADAYGLEVPNDSTS